MRKDESLLIALEAMKRAGADKAQAVLKQSEKSELNVEAGKMSLFRTTAEDQLSLTAFSGGRKGSISLNKLDRHAVEEAAAQAVAFAAASEPDEANDISPGGPPRTFTYGDEGPDRPAMYDRIKEFLAHTHERYPATILETCALDFTRTLGCFANTNGAFFDATTGIYGFGAMFTAKEGGKASSFNYSGASRRRMDIPLAGWGSIEELMRQQTEQLDPGSVGEKFVGDVIVTPDCLGDFVGALVQIYLSDRALIKGSSPFRDRLGQKVASDLLGLASKPRSIEIQDGYFVTPDGFEAKDSVIIEKGRLRDFALSLYGANKTGKQKSPNAGGCYTVDPGADSLAGLVASVKKGLLLCRFSGDEPTESGDFSGVAKNSYLIEDGRIAGAVNETMVSGNLGSFLESISGVTKERVDFGSAVFPWVKSGGITVSGK
jgi:PmbA protein